MGGPRRAPVAAIVGGALIFAFVELLAFYVPLYRPLLDPSSTAGAFEAAIARLNDLRTDPQRDVLVLGDSRVYSGLDPTVATQASAGRLRFLDGSVPGTTPRCWFFFVRAVDPDADRFRAIVVPVDTYEDDDGAIGSIDGDQRRMDLHYIVFRVGPADLAKLASSFGDRRASFNVGMDLLLRGPELREDVQALAADPAARVRAIRQARAADPYDPLAAHPRGESLTGLQADFRHARMSFPAGVADVQRGEIETQVLRVARPSPSYARYRRRWLGPIVERYARAGVPVIFVRLPTRPMHRIVPTGAGGSLVEFARMGGAQLLAQAPYLALERPGLFADYDHLDARGSRSFSTQLGRDVARALAGLPLPSARRILRPLEQGQTEVRLAGLHALASLLAAGVPLPFQSYEFWIFFALTAILFRATTGRLRWIVLLLASYYFYARWNGWYVLFLWILTVSDYAIAIVLERVATPARKLALSLGVAANLAFLGTFKYADFASGTVAALVGMHENPWLMNLIVPIGISFHTFQSISYLVDVYRGKIRAVRNLLD